MQTVSGYAENHGAQIYYEVSGEGQPLVFLHAGVADRRMWNDQVAFFSTSYQVVRYDLRGFGLSRPVPGDFTHRGDLAAVLSCLGVEHAFLVGCSMGGFCAMDFALEHPEAVDGLVMVGSGPSGLDLDVPTPAKFAEAEQAEEQHDWERLIELSAQIWYDGEGRDTSQVDATRRELMKQMQREALPYRDLEQGRALVMQPAAAERLAELKLPVLVICGIYDTPYIQGASDYMEQHILGTKKIMVESAHLPSMDIPMQFNQILRDFLVEHAKRAQ